MRLVVLALLLTTPVLAGCLGGDDAGDELERQSKARADVSEALGGLEGLVTDNAVQPVAGATVTLVEAELDTLTEEDGSFAFSNIDPGEYTIEVSRSGFVPATDAVEVRAKAVSTVDFILTHLATEVAYQQKIELSGFMECGFGIGYNVSAVPTPVNPLNLSKSGGIISYPICAEPNSLPGTDNTTNDRFDHFFSMDGPLHTLVVETVWDPSGGTLSDQMWVDMVPQGFHCGSIRTCEWSLIDHWGSSPLQGRVERDRLDHVQAYFIEQCEEGDDAWCGYSFFDEGWDLWIRTYVRWECQDAGPQACAVVQQPFEHVLTGFFNAPAPAGYTALQ